MQQPRHTVASCACGLGLGLACVACFLLLRLRQPNATCALIPSSSSSLPHHLLPHYLFPPPLPLRVTRAHLGKKHHKKGRDEVIDALDVAGAGVPDRPHVQDPAHAQAQAQAATSEPPHAQAQAAASRHVASAACCLLPAAAAPPCRTCPRPSTHTHTHIFASSLYATLSLSLSFSLSLSPAALPASLHARRHTCAGTAARAAAGRAACPGWFEAGPRRSGCKWLGRAARRWPRRTSRSSWPRRRHTQSADASSCRRAALRCLRMPAARQRQRVTATAAHMRSTYLLAAALTISTPPRFAAQDAQAMRTRHAHMAATTASPTHQPRTQPRVHAGACFACTMHYVHHLKDSGLAHAARGPRDVRQLTRCVAQE